MPKDCGFARTWLKAAQGGNVANVHLECRRQGWGRMRQAQSIIEKPLRLAGTEFDGGIGTHADSEIHLHAGMPIRRFRAMVGLDDNAETRKADSKARLVFSVEAAGKEIWRSRDLGLKDEPQAVDVTLPDGVRTLTLKAIALNGAIGYAHADWADVVVTLDDESEIRFPPDTIVQPVPNGSPVTFLYNGKPSSELLPVWRRELHTPTKNPDGVIEHRATWSDPTTSLRLTVELRELPGFEAVEWVARFRNAGTSDTPIIADVQALAASWSGGPGTKLTRSIGSPCRIDDFLVTHEPLEPGTTLRMAAGGGRSSNDWLPFFNLHTGDAGVIEAIGWSGQWAAEFAHSASGTVALRAGMEKTHLRLHPGEEMRTPRMLLFFWRGDRTEAHNSFRRLLLAHHTPRPDGKPLEGPLTIAHWGGMRTPAHLERVAVYAREKLDYDYYWVDAGWYGPPDSFSPDEFQGDWAKHVGNWQINPAAHPNGLRPISDATNKIGMKFLLWVEPERAIVGTPLAKEHPEWFLGERKENANILFNLGLPEARTYLTNLISNLITSEGIGLYRQDFNFDPLPYWRANDTEDRQGMSEIRYVEGHYALWDELLRRHPGLVIDNCASGGRRIDLETISRSVPLWRSDWQCRPDNDPIGGQVHGMGLSCWIPLHGTGTWGSVPGNHTAYETYRVRSAYGPAFQFSSFPYEYTPIRGDYPWDWHRARLAEYHRARPLFRGDYYPITEVTAAEEAWAAYQMHRPDLDEGFVMALRRPKAFFCAAELRLRGIDPAAEYEVEDADSGRKERMRGKKLLETGIRVDLPEPRSSKMVFYKKIK